MDTRKNKMAQIVANCSNKELTNAYADILKFRETGEIPASGYFKKIEKKIRTECSLCAECFHYAENEILLEIGRRFYNIVNEENICPVGSGKVLWYVNLAKEIVEKCTVFSARYKNSELFSFFVDFENGGFYEFEGSSYGKLFFEDIETAEQILKQTKMNTKLLQAKHGAGLI